MTNHGTQSQKLIPVAGSERPVVPGAAVVGPTDDAQGVFVTVVLRHSAADELARKVQDAIATSPAERRHLTREEFAKAHGANPDEVARVREFAQAHGLAVERVDAAGCTVLLSGTVQAIRGAFGIQLYDYRHPEFTYRSHKGPVFVPAHLADAVTAVLGLDNRPQAKPHFRILDEETARAAGQVSYTPPQVAGLYQFPAKVDCSDQCIGLIELGGGYNRANIDQYFASLGLAAVSITAVSVDGGSNQPTGSPNGPDGEVDLDIEVAASVAPGARLAVYFAPNTDAGFHDAITTAIHDTTNKPSVISISWGGPEASWSQQAVQAMDSALQSAALLGITVCVAAGDQGSSDGMSDGLFHVDFPAASPHALACGGTRLVAQGTTVESEVVWNDGPQGGATGGGVSALFALPTWQQGAGVPASANPGAKVGRGVPDVAADADPVTGYSVLVDGRAAVIGGTSAVAPLWAGLVAIANHQLGKPAGFLNTALYSMSGSAGAFRDITSGNNDISGPGSVYPAGPGWDACTGLGSPVGTNLVARLSGGHAT